MKTFGMSLGLVALITGVGAGTVYADDTQVLGKKLLLLDKHAVSGKAKVVFVAKDSTPGGVHKGPSGDPPGLSGTVVVFPVSDPANRAVFSLDALPDGEWKKNTDSVAKYVNSGAGVGGPGVKAATIKPDRILKVVTKNLGDGDASAGDDGAGDIDLGSLSESDTLMVVVTVENALDASTHVMCTQFEAPQIKSLAGGSVVRVLAKDSSLPAACPVCGDGNVDLGEECDDGNTQDGDCCSSSCVVEPNGSPCDDGLFCTGVETCSAGVCQSSGDPCSGADGDSHCSESCDEGADDCSAPDPNGSACNDNDVCTVGEACLAGSCTGATALDCKVAFVTSGVMNGSMGGVAGADAMCQSRAVAAGLPGTFLAWISDSTTSPAARFTQSSDPYVSTRGVGASCTIPGSCDGNLRLLADDWADLTDGGLDHQMRDEFGNSFGGTSLVWTGTEGDGSGGTLHCSDWSSSTGAGIGGSIISCTGDGCTGQWSRANLYSCGNSFHLYCFEQ